MKLARLVRFYPKRWRERYGEEITDLLETEPPSVRRAVDLLRGLIDAHLHPELVGSGTVARLARVAMLTVLIGLTPVATGAVGYYVGRSQVSPVAEPLFPVRMVDTFVLTSDGAWRKCASDTFVVFCSNP
jgi:hypothetical protein